MSSILVCEGIERQLNPSSVSSENIAKLFKLERSSIILIDAVTNIVHLPQDNHFDPVIEAGKTYKVEGDKIKAAKSATPEITAVVKETTEVNATAASNHDSYWGSFGKFVSEYGPQMANQLGQFVNGYMSSSAPPSSQPSTYQNRQLENRPYRGNYRDQYQDDSDVDDDDDDGNNEDDDDSHPDDFEYEDNKPWGNGRHRY